MRPLRIPTRAQLTRILQMWIFLFAAGSLQPFRPKGLHAAGPHRALHIGVFAGTALVLVALSEGRRQKLGRAFALAGLGLFLEFAQHIFYRNPMEWWDVRDDTLAIVLAYASYQLVSLGSRRHPQIRVVSQENL